MYYDYSCGSLGAPGCGPVVSLKTARRSSPGALTGIYYHLLTALVTVDHRQTDKFIFTIARPLTVRLEKRIGLWLCVERMGCATGILMA